MRLIDDEDAVVLSLLALRLAVLVLGEEPHASAEELPDVALAAHDVAALSQGRGAEHLDHAGAKGRRRRDEADVPLFGGPSLAAVEELDEYGHRDDALSRSGAAVHDDDAAAGRLPGLSHLAQDRFVGRALLVDQNEPLLGVLFKERPDVLNQALRGRDLRPEEVVDDVFPMPRADARPDEVPEGA